MSAWLSDYSQSQPYTGTGDAYIIAYVECDTQADLPAVNQFTGWILDKESKAHVIDDNTMWELNSSGSWIRQDDAGRFNVYTQAEVDDKFDDENRLLNMLFMSNCKNLLNVWGQTSQTLNGIQWTINNDGTVRANGLATADSVLYIWRNAFPPPLLNFDIVIDGIPSGASDSTFDIVYTSTASGTISVTSKREIARSVALTTTRLALRVYSGQNVDIVFEPMVVRKDIYSVSPGFAPYAPTNAELYQLIRSYHP